MASASASASASPNEAAELKLISSIRYKFASVSGDEKKLSEALRSQLVPLLGKAGSQHKPVRDAAFQAFISVNNFIKPVGVVLPVAALIDQYKKTTSPMVKQLDLGLIKQGILRLGEPKRRELVPEVLRGISKETSPSGSAGFFNIFLRLLPSIKIPGRGIKEDLSFREDIGLSDSADASYVARWLGKLFLLRQDLALAAGDELEKMLLASPSGLSREDVAFLTNNNPTSWKPGAPASLSLPECKTKAVNVLASGAFTEEERYIPIICAAGSADSRITSIADDVLKRTSVDLEKKEVVQSLYNAHKTFPAAQRIQILRLLSKSVIACSFENEAVQAIKQDFELVSGGNASVLGLEALRLHKSLLAFLSSIARNSSVSTNTDSSMRPTLVLILKDYILAQGWPAPETKGSQSQFQEEQRIRGNAYETIGILAAKGCHFEPKAKISLLRWLIQSFMLDPTPNIAIHIESAMSNMMSLFGLTTDASPESKDLKLMLLEFMAYPEEKCQRSVRHVVTRFANNCLPYHDIHARCLDLLALCTRSERQDIAEEGRRGLDPWWATKLRPNDDALVLPDWAKLVHMFFGPSQDLPAEESFVNESYKQQILADGVNSSSPTPVRYITRILFLTALNENKFEMGWESQLEMRLQNDLETRESIRKYLASADWRPALTLLNAIIDSIPKGEHPEPHCEEWLNCLTEILSFAPSMQIIRPIASRTSSLMPMVRWNDQKLRQLASKAFGVMAPLCNESPALIDQMLQSINEVPEEAASQSGLYQGYLACLGSYYSRATYYGDSYARNSSDIAQFVYDKFKFAMQDGSQELAAVATESIAQLWTANLNFPRDENELTETVGFLSKLADRGQEKAIWALGRLAIPSLADGVDSLTDPVGMILRKLFELSETKRTEVLFAAGEAIACAIARWDSKAVQLSLDVEPSEAGRFRLVNELGKRPSKITVTLDKLIGDCKATKPSLLKASGIWLFCVIQYCSDLPEIQSRLRECQVAFMRLLTARDELIQETASRGLALVYEKGDPSLKGDLVKDLVASFTGNKTQLKVDEETELFDAGALPTGEGKYITSYKDIVSLANEVGDQSLVYRFMSLATNAATWTARSAFGRFGLSNILSDAELDPKIYPKLYRYRFDPNPNVRRSMDDIWKAVVKDQNVVFDTYFDAIMDELLKSTLDGREWRVREASCAAIADLIYGQPFSKYEKYYTDIWRVTLRVLDDKKSSVRAAAEKLCMGLSKTLVTRLQEHNSSAAAKAMIAQVLPFLLSDRGVENSVQEVQATSIITILEVVKNGGDTLKPFVPTIIIHFLGLLSTLEPGVVNYYYQRVSEESREHLDKQRSSAVTQSPMFECVVNCLRFVDEGVMKELAPQLVSTIKSAIGMQTKVGCSEVLSTLALRHAIILPPYNATFLKTMETQVLDRNHETSKAYARASAYLLRSAAPESRDRFTSRLLDLYFGAEDSTRRQKIADAVLAIAKISPDVFNDLEASLLPLAYAAKHDMDDYVSEEFEAVWSQHAGGSHTIKRLIGEITELVSKGLNSPKWDLQHGAALTIASMITALSSGAGKGGQFADADLGKIWPVLDKALSLKTFKGKEKVAVAYPLFVLHGKKLWSTDSALAAQMKKVAVREAKRNNDEYRPHAFQALADFAAAREDLDMYAEVVGLVSEYLNPDIEAHKVTELERKTSDAALKAAMTCYNRKRMRDTPSTILGDVITTVEGAKRAISLARDTWFTSAAELMNKAVASEVTLADLAAGVVATRWFRLLVTEDEVMLENQRLSRAKALGAYVSAWKKGIFGPVGEQGSLHEEMEQKLKAMAEADRSLEVQKLLNQVVQQLAA
ncbi:proteasome component [Hypoxylon cercidicola]|nr:proteasome component [Hypoxylon cercidicola]